MATTEPRTGFRLPWNADHRNEPDTPAANDVVETTGTTWDASAGMSGSADAQAEAELHPATAEGAAAEAPAEEATAGAATSRPVGETDGEAAALEAWPAQTVGPAGEPDAPGERAPQAPRPTPHRPTKFLADLTRAMQTAAEGSRASTLEQVHAESKACVERIHALSADEATDLKRRSDDDISEIRDRSKAEIARIREETERRIADRKTGLEAELERHAASIERRIDSVQARVADFEAEMEAFFQRLLQEEDPTLFASLAENLPEPPSFEEVAALAELEPAVDFTPTAPVEAPSVPTVEPTADLAEPTADLADSTHLTEAFEPTEAFGPTDPREAAEPVPTATIDTAETGSSKPVATDLVGAAPEETFETEDREPNHATWSAPSIEPEAVDDRDRELAMAATQSAAEPADREAWPAADSSGPATDAGTEAAAAPAIEVDPWPDETTVAVAEPDVTPEAAIDDPEAATRPWSDERESDPRLAALGLRPDLAEAEAAAVADAASTADPIAEIGEESLAARLADLVPGATDHPAAAAPPTASQRTQVVVVGLVSVASIASFKRQLGRVPGVQSVGVSSGPDGEFVFNVAHGDDLSLRDVIPTLPGFQARVTGAGEGIVNVSARDPEAES